MGFSTIRSWRSGREVYACEFSKEGCITSPCRALRCPYNWCQRYYACTNCMPKVRYAFTKASGKHENCRKNMELADEQHKEQQELLANGAYLRCAALGIDAGRVHVLFRNKERETIGRYMRPETYDALGIGTNTTLQDYEKLEAPLVEAPAEFPA